MKAIVLFILITLAIGLGAWAVSAATGSPGCPANGSGAYVCN